MKLQVSKKQFKVIYQLLRHTRLGTETELDQTILDLVDELGFIADKEDIDDDELPTLSATFNENEGLTLELSY